VPAPLSFCPVLLSNFLVDCDSYIGNVNEKRAGHVTQYQYVIGRSRWKPGGAEHSLAALACEICFPQVVSADSKTPLVCLIDTKFIVVDET
jgi:hypothetical protein